MKTNKEMILVVEDDSKIRNFICYALSQDGFSYKTAATAQEALSLLVFECFDMVLLDLGLPDFDGMEVIKKLREWSEIPIIIVSARDQDQEKAAALDAGADDYLTKPFSATELMARIRVASRHLRMLSSTHIQSIFSVGFLTLDLDKRLCYLDEVEVHLTPLEYKLLSLFFKNIGKVLTTGFIITAIWGNGYGEDTQALRTLMAGLRRKIEDNPAKPRYILTEIGVGYRLSDK